MKTCITAIGNNPESKLDPRFGRCQYFIFYDTEGNSFEAIANPNVDAGSGAGIQSAQLVVSKGASIVITGEVGPKAEKVLKAANMQIINEKSTNITIKEVMEKYKNDNLQISGDIEIKNNLLGRLTGILRLGRRRGNCGRVIGGQGMGKGVRRGYGFGRGFSNFCVCPNCGNRQQHQRGVPCQSIKCTKCDSIMLRE